MLRVAFLLVFIFFNVCSLWSQDTLRGRIFDINSDSVLSGGRVRNITKALDVRQEQNGNYSIPAKEGDKLSFFVPGFTVDTVIVQAYMLNTGYDISLRPESILLPGVTIEAYNLYRSDSLANREHYSESFQKQAPLTGYNRPTEGVGISISPLTYFSSESKQKRKLRKKLLEDERDAYIDFCFPRNFIERVANIHNDTLNRFMLRFRPSYEFCKNKSRGEMLMYINDCLIRFNKEMKAERDKG